MLKRNHGQYLVGKRIEIPVHYDTWMRGARYGVVTAYHPRKTPGTSDYVLVKLDLHDGLWGKVKVWSLDWDYCKVLDA